MHIEEMKIMLVEDDPAHAEIVRRNLEGLPTPHLLIHVEDGQMALDMLFPPTARNVAAPAMAYPELIILDLRLPKVDGLEVLRTIKSDAVCHRIPVVVLTTSGAPRDIQSAYDYHANSYLVKPLNSQAFVSLLADFGKYWMKNNRFAAGCQAFLTPITGPIREGVNILAATAAEISATVSQLASSSSESWGWPMTANRILLPGHVYVAPSGVHTGLGSGGRLALEATPPENGLRPSIAHLFRSVASVAGLRTVLKGERISRASGV